LQSAYNFTSKIDTLTYSIDEAGNTIVHTDTSEVLKIINNLICRKTEICEADSVFLVNVKNILMAKK
jgi:hypothetical protein